MGAGRGGGGQRERGTDRQTDRQRKTETETDRQRHKDTLIHQIHARARIHTVAHTHTH